MIDCNNSQSDSYTFIVHKFTTISFFLPPANQTNATASETPTVVKDSRLQETWILVSNDIFIRSNFAITWNSELYV